MHSRYVVEARFYFRENLDILIDSLLRAWAKHGAPRELYADNGKVYHSNGLTLACAKLAIKKLHRPPREPEPGGLVERFFQTVQTQFTSEVLICQTLSFTQLNQAFSAWLATGYHQQVHSSTGHTPDKRYHVSGRSIRHVDVTQVESYFYRHETRTVDPTYSDVSIDKRLYRVDPRLRGMQVKVQFNPFRSDPQQPDEVILYDLQDVYLGVAQRYERERGAHGKMPTPEPPKPLLESPYIKCLLDEHQRQLSDATQAGINYHSAMQHDVLSLTQLCQHIARHLGRSGLSGLDEAEHSAIEAFYQKHPQVRSWHVPRAAQQAAGGGLPQLLWALVQLLSGEGGPGQSSPAEPPPKDER